MTKVFPVTVAVSALLFPAIALCPRRALASVPFLVAALPRALAVTARG